MINQTNGLNQPQRTNNKQPRSRNKWLVNAVNRNIASQKINVCATASVYQNNDDNTRQPIV